ncbi:hypothetical protein AZG88_43255 [Rhodococcus sp. LB1]|nr:hypothetical protein AZG88_43255 [Rhodococcus sp. LB1]
MRDTEKILTDRGQPNLRQDTVHKSSPPACVLPCDWETCDTGGSLAVRPDPTRRAGTVDAVPPPGRSVLHFRRIDPGTRTMSMTFIQDRALTTTAHSGRHVASSL